MPIIIESVGLSGSLSQPTSINMLGILFSSRQSDRQMVTVAIVIFLIRLSVLLANKRFKIMLQKAPGSSNFGGRNSFVSCQVTYRSTGHIQKQTSLLKRHCCLWCLQQTSFINRCFRLRYLHLIHFLFDYKSLLPHRMIHTVDSRLCVLLLHNRLVRLQVLPLFEQLSLRAYRHLL